MILEKILGTLKVKENLYRSGRNFIKVEEQINDLPAQEVGTWTPTIVGGTTNPVITYTVQEGRFVKIGNLTHVNFFIRATLTGGSGTVSVASIPVAPIGSREQGVGYASIGTTQFGIVRLGNPASNTVFRIAKYNNTSLDISEINNGAQFDIMGSITFRS